MWPQRWPVHPMEGTVHWEKEGVGLSQFCPSWCVTSAKSLPARSLRDAIQLNPERQLRAELWRQVYLQFSSQFSEASHSTSLNLSFLIDK